MVKNRLQGVGVNREGRNEPLPLSSLYIFHPCHRYKWGTKTGRIHAYCFFHASLKKHAELDVVLGGLSKQHLVLGSFFSLQVERRKSTLNRCRILKAILGVAGGVQLSTHATRRSSRSDIGCHRNGFKVPVARYLSTLVIWILVRTDPSVAEDICN
jgi:hypothetical protein